MRKAIISVVVVILAVAGLAVVSVAGRVLGLRARLLKAAATDESHSIVVAGLTRYYLLHVPSNLASGKPVPLVLVFHGGGGHDWNMPGFTHFDALADEQGFLVAYPDSVNGSWNDGRSLSTADDVGFVRALVDEVSRSHSVDPKGIYATGISNGGFFSNRLACDLADKFAAIASVAATMPQDLVPLCKPSRSISILYIQGTKDPLVPIDGGNIGFVRGRSRGLCISLNDAAKFWRTRDGTSTEPAVAKFSDRVDDGTHVRRETWTAGRDSTEVVVYTIEGGGHTWPGGPQYLPVRLVGKASQNLDATRTIWDFFRSHSLR
ncbi:MAG TPA: PHB depolymerase family esterase [Candidatus Acidoferrales bacterium]|nr:PHB depolymerase family esterase [Candidatus Acidoferrales bacterium]